MQRGREAAVLLVALLIGVGDLAAQVPDTLTAPDTAQVPDSMAQSDPAARQGLPEEVVTHLTHLMSAFYDTPGGMGLIPTGMAEAEIAAQYVREAGKDSTSLSNMTSNMAYVLNAIDPTEVGSGFGLGYGFKRAAAGVRTHMELATQSGADGTVLFHAPFIERAADGAIARADDAIAMARRIQRAQSAEEARPLVNRLARLVRAMTYGSDSDGDGRIGQADEEVGLAQALYHLELIYRVEGLPIPDDR